jgi:hypothetical protein
MSKRNPSISQEDLRKVLEKNPQRSIDLYNQLTQSTEQTRRYEAMTNAELAEELLTEIWADLPMFSKQSDLVDVVIERLKDGEG